MGIFDDLKKLGQDIGKEVEKNIGTETYQSIKNAVIGTGANTSNGTNSFTNTQSSKEIPAEYSSFPKFRDSVSDVSTKETEKYTRCTMNFTNVSDEEVSTYISKINSLGYTKGSEVRFDKGNTYIIVDNNYGDLNLVFHIKK